MKPNMHRFRVRKSKSTSSSSSHGPSQTRTDQPSDKSAQSENRKLGILACETCRRFKKRCSKTIPQCSLCEKTGRDCSLSEYLGSSSTTSLEIRQLREKIRKLNDHITRHCQEPYLENSSDDAGFQALPCASEAYQDNASPTPSPEDSRQKSASQSYGAEDLETSSPEPNDNPLSLSTPIDTVVIPPSSPIDAAEDRSGIQFIDAYFRHVHRAYPFVDPSRMYNTAKTVTDFVIREPGAESTLLYLVMVVGCTTLERAGYVSHATMTSFKVSYSEIIQECMEAASLDSLQILLLLAIYSMYDPLGLSTTSIVGVATRQALELGLSRNSYQTGSMLSKSDETQNRTFWSVFIIDRMLAASVGLPFGLTDANMNVPLPSLTVEEFASPRRGEFASNLQVSRHIIQIRRLEGSILAKVHLRSRVETSSLTQSDRVIIVSKLRSALENWYSNGCLLSFPESDNIPMYTSISWLNARYYNLLVLLYYPNHFNSGSKSITTAELFGFIQNFLRYNHALLQQCQLPLNRVTLYRLLPICVVLSRHFRDSQVHHLLAAEIRHCIELLRAFPKRWEQAHRAANLLDWFSADLISDRASPDVHPCRCVCGASAPVEATIESTSHHLAELVRETLGQTCCYQFDT